MAENIRDVFISYHEASAGELAGEIADKLERSDITCWYAKRDLPSGADFADHIPQQIDGCKAFLLILNEGAAYSDFVRNELGIAFNRRDKRGDIEILPFQWEDCANGKLEFFLTSIQIIRVADGPTERRVQFLAEAVARKLGRELRDKDAERKAELERVIVKTRDFLEHELCLDEDRTTYLLNALARTYQPNPPQTRMPLLIPLSKRIVDSGTLGNLSWTLDSERCLTISGRGEMESVGEAESEERNPSWWAYKDIIASVIIQDGVSSLGRNAFAGCAELWSVAIPNSVTTIGKYAFYKCPNLRVVRIPDSVSEIAEGAFRDCKNLRIVRFSENLASIGDAAFRDCESLRAIRIPDSVNEIEKRAFHGCKNLQTVRFPQEMASLGAWAFYNCDLTMAKIPNGVTTLAPGVFECNRDLMRVNIPDSVVSIETHAFFNCPKLESVTIPKGVNIIKREAFYGCDNMRSVTILNGYIRMESNAFSYEHLRIYIPENMPLSDLPYDMRSGGRVAYIKPDAT